MPSDDGIPAPSSLVWVGEGGDGAGGGAPAMREVDIRSSLTTPVGQGPRKWWATPDCRPFLRDA